MLKLYGVDIREALWILLPNINTPKILRSMSYTDDFSLLTFVHEPDGAQVLLFFLLSLTIVDCHI